MYRHLTLLAAVILTVVCSGAASAEDTPATKAALLLDAMADGIGDLVYASPEWVEAAQAALAAATAAHTDGLENLGQFTLCVVAQNPPAYLRIGGPLAWHVKFDGAKVEARAGELPAGQCDFKVQGDHSILSNLARIQRHGNEPTLVAVAKARLEKLSRWEVEGRMPENEALGAVLRSVQDTMAVRTMARFIFMTPEWVSTARHVVSTRAKMAEYASGIQDVVFKFYEQFTNGPGYAFPDGADGGFWVYCNRGEITVGVAPMPEELEPADHFVKGLYTPVLPVGRTFDAAMTKEDEAEKATYSAAAFAPDEETKKSPIALTQPTGKSFSPELSKRTSGELPSDYDTTIKAAWATPQKFDRDSGYDPSWLLYDRFDMYGEPR